MTFRENVTAPTTGQPKIQIASPSQKLVASTSIVNVIIFSPHEPRHVDARAGKALIRYTSDPATGLWTAGGDGVRSLLSPYALARIERGQHGYEIVVRLPRTGKEMAHEGSLDDVASALWRAGRGLGCRADRQTVFWALTEFCGQVRRQAAARGVAE